MNEMEGKNMLREDVLFNRSDNSGLTFEDYEVLSYIFQKTECRISSIWSDLEASSKFTRNSLEKLIKNKLALRIIDKKGDKVHLTEKGVLLALLLDTYSMYAPAAERGEPVAVELMSYLHMLKIPHKEQRLELSKQLEDIAMELLNKSKEIKQRIKEVT